MSYQGRATALAITSIDDFKEYLRGLDFSSWRPGGIVQHNTASPTLQQWWHSSTPPEQRVQNLISYYRDELGWSSCPHAFVDGVTIWITCDFNVKGVHSPSWNGTRLGIEMVGDYDTESDESGEGKAVLDQSTELFGECCTFFGWNVDNNFIKQHKEDPQTTHDCPGRNVVKSEFLNDVTNYIANGGDDHQRPQLPRAGTVVGVAAGDSLNIRASASSSAPVIGTAVNDDQLSIVGEAMNGSTKWLRCQIGKERGPAVAVFGWVSSQYVSVREDPALPEGEYEVLRESGTVSWFGGPNDMGVSPSEGLAFIYDYDQAPNLFLAQQPPGTTGLARRLDPSVFYIAMRWDYDRYPKEMLASGLYRAKVYSPTTGRVQLAWPADWGPNDSTGRTADISPGLMSALGIETDAVVNVVFPV